LIRIARVILIQTNFINFLIDKRSIKLFIKILPYFKKRFFLSNLTVLKSRNLNICNKFVAGVSFFRD
jgi:hypothetical protein